MLPVALRAHYDGEKVVLDDPTTLPADTRLLVTVLTADAPLEEERAWLRALAASESFAFLADPVEDIYSAQDGEPFHDAI